jgi:hypothetical protein
LSPGQTGRLLSELSLQLVDLADVLSELGVGGALADAGQRPADAFGAVGDDAGGDQGVEDLKVPCAARLFDLAGQRAEIIAGCFSQSPT